MRAGPDQAPASQAGFAVGLKAIALLLVLRAAFLLAGQAALGGDGLGYVISAQEILRTGMLPPAPTQPVSISVLLVPILALIGAAAMVDYTAIPYPGYPGFVDDPIASSLHVIQVGLDILVVLVLMIEARKLLVDKPAWLQKAVLGFLALQPFTAAYTPHVLSDHITMTAFFLGGYLIYRHLARGASLAAAAGGAFLLGVAGWLRFDMLPVVVALTALILLVMVRSHGGGHAVRIAALCVPLLSLAPLAMAAYQFRSTGELSYIRVGLSGDVYTSNRGGYYGWVRKWLILYPADMQLAGWADVGQGKDWRGFDVANYPSRAFAGDAHRRQVQAMLTAWREGGYSADVEAGFKRVAADYAGSRPIMSFALVPAARMLHFWINTEGARPIQATLRLKPPLSRAAVVAVFPFRLMFVLLGLIGLVVLWGLRWRHWAEWDHPLMLARICSVMVLLRTFELGVLGTVVQSGLMEPRYALPAMPAMLLVAVVGVGWLAGVLRSRRAPGTATARSASLQHRVPHG